MWIDWPSLVSINNECSLYTCSLFWCCLYVWNAVILSPYALQFYFLSSCHKSFSGFCSNCQWPFSRAVTNEERIKLIILDSYPIVLLVCSQCCVWLFSQTSSTLPHSLCFERGLLEKGRECLSLLNFACI